MRYIFLLFIIPLSFPAFSQINAMNVAENTLKISGMKDEIFYYGFAEGDQLIFSFQEMDNKELKEIEISEYPSNSRFMEYKTKKVENKVISILKTGVYAFRLSNNALFGRICKIKIDRIPASDRTRSFNTSVKWIEKPDTSWNVYTKEVLAGYDSLLIQKTKRTLVKSEQKEELIMDKNERVHSKNSIYGTDKSSVVFSLPESVWFGMKTKRVISWAYWVGVGDNANKAWKQNCEIMSSLVKGAVGFVYSPLGGLLAGQLTELVVPKMGEDVSYKILDSDNRDIFLQGVECQSLDFGAGIAGYKKFTNNSALHGTWYIVLYNDNIFQAIDVNVKVVALVETNNYEDQPYTEQKITPRYGKKTFKEPSVKMIRLPVTSTD